MKSANAAIVHWAQYMVPQHAHCTYSQGSQRMSGVHRRGVLPFVSDCSAFVTAMYAWANAPDPNGFGYNNEGYTGSLINHNKQIDLALVRVGDLVIYFDGPGFSPSTGSHVALIVEVASDPLTVSMGKQGDPNYCRVSQDGRAHKFYTCSTLTRKVVSPESFFHLSKGWQRP